MSFIKKEGKESSIWDWVLLVVIVVGGAGFWFYYSSQKKSTINGFDIADSLFQSGQYKQSLEKYNELRYSDYLEPHHDSILSMRLDTLQIILEDKRKKD